MSSMLKRSLLVAGTVLALGQGAARAADFRDMTVNVPFPFVVENRVMPAGKVLAAAGRPGPVAVADSQ